MPTPMAYAEGEFRKYNGKLITCKSLETLAGLLDGITFDGEVSPSEMTDLGAWLDKHEEELCCYHYPVRRIREIVSDGVVDPEELEELKWIAQKLTECDESGDLIKQSLQKLHGLFHGVLAGEISVGKVGGLRKWLLDHDFLQGTYPYDEISDLLEKVLEDGYISDEEKKVLTSFMADFIDFSESGDVSEERYQELKRKYTLGGVCENNPVIEIVGKTFCLTGEFESGTRAEVSDRLSDKGANVVNSVTKKVDYLVIGDNGNECWAFVGYGRKVEKAIEQQKKGGQIKIVREKDVRDCLS